MNIEFHFHEKKNQLKSIVNTMLVPCVLAMFLLLRFVAVVVITCIMENFTQPFLQHPFKFIVHMFMPPFKVIDKNLYILYKCV